MRMSSAALRPSVAIRSMLSSSGRTWRVATFSARSAREATYCSSSTVGCTGTVEGARLPSSRCTSAGTGRSRSSAVFTSANTDHIRSSSCPFWKRANRVFMRNVLPVGEISICVTSSPNVAAHASNAPTDPFALAASAGRGFRSEQHRSFRDRGGHRIRPAVLHETLGAPSSQ